MSRPAVGSWTPGSPPAYAALHRSGELKRRAEEAVAALAHCEACPRRCGANRLAGETGVCRIGRYARVSSYFPHHGEENCLSGWRGSGTIFFAQCNLRCVFCQNYDVSQQILPSETSPAELAGMMLELQALGCHNINLVTPSHVVAQWLEALPLAVEAGLRIPIVFNTSAYDSVATLRRLEGVVDIYLPDFKIWYPARAAKYLTAKDYPEVARQALCEMNRQVGGLMLDSNELATRGMLVRHLVMPAGLAGTELIMQFLAREVSPGTAVNVMAQYHPAGQVRAGGWKEIDRRILPNEYAQAVSAAEAGGLRLV
jgi:putative pyruvate formate lyase activating enzyme